MASWQYGPDGARGHAKYLGAKDIQAVLTEM